MDSWILYYIYTVIHIYTYNVRVVISNIMKQNMFPFSCLIFASQVLTTEWIVGERLETSSAEAGVG